MGFILNPYRFGGSAFSPDDIAGLMAWYDGADTATHTVVGTVTAVADKSVNARDLTTQSAGGNINNTATLNGLNVLTWSGQVWLYNATDFMFDNGAITIMVVAQCDVGTGFAPFVFETNTADTNSQYGIRAQDLTSPTVNQELIMVGAKAGGSTWLLGRSGIDGQAASPFLMTALDSGTNWTIRTDGVQRATNSYTRDGTTPINKFLVGGMDLSLTDHYLDGFIAEVLIYDTVLTGTDLSDAESYLLNKWGL